jgi:ubiquinone/menaquinone biosynthesis C-methylase UbiE
MNKGQISNTLRQYRLLYPLDKLRYVLEKSKNKKLNKKFKKDNPEILLPPDYLMYESFQINYSKYYFGGKTTAEWIFKLVGKHINLSGGKILDWGCGPGRLIRHMPDISNNQSSFYGTDYNKESIHWCKNNIQKVNFNHNNLEAILPYEDNTFDAIYGISIFTHLSKEMHFNWFNELKRVLKPGGVILITTQGKNFRPKLIGKEKKKFDQGELIVKGNVKEGHRTYSAFHPDPFLKLLFKDVHILDKIVISPKGKDYLPQDRWLLKKKTLV